MFNVIKQQAIKWFDEPIDQLYDRLFTRCEEFVYGRNRAVFIFPKYVIKLPRNWDGSSDNDWEGSLISCDYIPLARTRLFYWKNSVPIVLMERVTHATKKDIEEKLGEYPDWCSSVDCGQVGWNKHGNLVAYDYGCR